jgi:hypothetical protein
MPAYLTHRLAGEQILGKLQRDIPDRDDFNLGLQGGDIYFGYRPSPLNTRTGPRLGGALHAHKTKEFFTQSMRWIRDDAGEGKDALVAYFCGYIGHYCVDKRLHPFVYAHASDSATHNHLEFMLDAWILHDRKGMTAIDYDIAGEIKAKKLHPAIGRWYKEIFMRVYGLEAGEDTAAAAQKQFSRLRRILRKPGIYFYVMAFFAWLVAKKDLRIFLHPKKLTNEYFTQEQYEGLKKDLELAVREAATKIGLFLDYIDGIVPLETVMADFDNVNFKGDKLSVDA